MGSEKPSGEQSRKEKRAEIKARRLEDQLADVVDRIESGEVSREKRERLEKKELKLETKKKELEAKETADRKDEPKGIARDIKIRTMRAFLKIGSIGGVEWVHEFKDDEIKKLCVEVKAEKNADGEAKLTLKWLEMDLEEAPSYWP